MTLEAGRMSVSQAVRDRRAVRAFEDRAVPDELLAQVLEGALRSPSGGNLQPWRLHVLRDAALSSLSATVAERAQAGVQETPEHAVYPADLWEPFRTRRFKNGEDLYATIGIAREDRPLRLQQLAKNFAFFGAPVGLFFTIERRMGHAQWIDVGIAAQTVMLLATEAGLATCPQAAWAAWPQTLSEALHLGDEETVALGMALGYEDTSHPINTMRADRRELLDGIVFHHD